MKQVVILVVVIALFVGVFTIILSPSTRNQSLLVAWPKMNPNQRRMLALNRLPWAGRKLSGQRTIEVDERFQDSLDNEARGEAVNWADLVSFNWKPGASIPPQLKALHGKYVELGGQMIADEHNKPFKEFYFVRSLFEFSSGPEPTLTHLVKARLAKGDFIYRANPLIITGRMSVGVERIGAEPVSIFRVEIIRIELPPDANFPRRTIHGDDEHDGHDGHGN